MAHTITQLMPNTNQSYLVNPPSKIIQITTYSTELYQGVLRFDDKLLSAPLQKGVQYYIQIKIRCKDVAQYVMFYLTDSQVEDRQMIGQYAVARKSNASILNEQDQYALFSFIVTPFRNYNYILIQLERNNTNILNNNLEVDVIAYNYLKIRNLLDPNQEVVKIGIQGPPGLLLCINQEGVRIGPSGIYEIKNSQINVSFFGIPITKNQLIDSKTGGVKTFFLVDIEYKKKTNKT